MLRQIISHNSTKMGHSPFHNNRVKFQPKETDPRDSLRLVTNEMHAVIECLHSSSCKRFDGFNYFFFLAVNVSVVLHEKFRWIE